MKNFEMSNDQSIKEYFTKKGMKLFYQLNENLNAYRRSFEKEKLI